MGCAQRSSGGHPESVVVTDPKGELFENLAPYFREHGFYVKAVNFLDMAHSDGWNCLAGLEANPDLVTTVANTIIQNTSGPKEADDFWSRAELNLLMALIHYVCNLKDARGNLLPLEQRSLGDVYKILAYKSVNEINRILAELPPEHPAKGPHGLFLKARENLWGNIIIGLGNRLAVFQNPLVDKITRNHDVDLLLPGQKPCAYFVIISAQDSAYRFLSSLFFSLTFPQLSNYARLHGGRLPVLTNFCLEEYLNIGYMEGISDVFNSIRGFNMSVQVAVQSLSQWQEKYPGKEWENQLGSFDMTLYMGCNDMTSAEYFAKKCGILDGCELECFAPETALVFENAIERLFYADSFRIGNATLPQSRVRAKLRRLDGMILREAESKLRANQERNVKNSTAYTMAVLFNCIAESESDLMIDPYLNTICAAV